VIGMAENTLPPRGVGVGRRGLVYLAGAAAAVLTAALVVGVLAYLVLAGAAAGAWLTRQQAVVRWTLTVLAVGLVVLLVLGLAVGGPGATTRGGPTAPAPGP
jgi:hypothetical protein